MKDLPAEVLEDLTDWLKYHLSPLERKILRLLKATQSRPLSARALADALYADREDGGPDSAENIISVTICKMRQKGVKIHSRYRVGYSLSELPVYIPYHEVRQVLLAARGRVVPIAVCVELAGLKSAQTLRMAVCKLRAAGVKIETVPGQGYRIP